MVASTLSIGQMAVIGVNTEDNGNPQKDAITFMLLAPVGSGTQIFFTDRTWTPTPGNNNIGAGSFPAAGGGDGTYTFTAATDLPAGTVITIPQIDLTAAGINLQDTGDTIYVYQGAINAPTHFLHAVEIADGNTTFNGSLVNTGLSAGVSAVAIAVDNAEFGTRTHNINAIELFAQINNRDDWVQNDNSPQDGTLDADATPNSFGHAHVAPDAQIWVAGSGAGEAIVTINLDATYNAGSVGYQIVQAFQNAANLFHPSDITLDTVNDKFFFVDADLNGNNRIIQGSISQILNNPGQAPSFSVLYSNASSGATNSMRTLSIDPVNGKIYFDVGETFVRINYDTEAQVPTVLANLGAAYGFPSYITQMTINYATGTVYLGSSSVTSAFGADLIDANQVFVATGLTGSNAANSLSFTPINWGANGNQSVGPEGDVGLNANTFWPEERGTIRGIDVDPTTGRVYIATGTVILDNDANGNTTYYGGVWMYDPSNGSVTNLYTQNGSTGPVGLLYYIEVDPATGHYYVIDEIGANGVEGDGGVFRGSLTVPGTPTRIATVGNINGLGPQGLEIQHAPTLAGTSNAGLGVTEASLAPLSGETSRVTLFSGLTASDIDTPDGGDELRGALVRVSGNFQSGATHQDILTINGTQSGTIAGSGISYSYNPVNGHMTLTGVATVAEYAAALAMVQFSTSGDDVTAYGSATNRTVAASVFDGLLYSDEITNIVNVTGINDAPVNTPGAAMTFVEDTTGAAGTTPPVNAVTGISVFDVDANPATQDITVTLSVGVGTLTIRTDVTGGLAAGEVVGNGTGTLVLTGTQNQINATLAAVNASSQANGLIYTPPANFNGATALTITTNDNGLNGNDPGVSGTGTSEQDVDTKTINVTNVNDAPVLAGDGTEAAATILEDVPSATGQTVLSLFGGQYSDPLDQQQSGGNPTGSTADALAGIAVIANGSSPATGQWQYFDGAAWINIGPASLASAQLITASTAIRFNPAQDYFGAAPTLTVHLVDASGAAFVNGQDVNLSGGSATGGTTRYSTGTVILSQDVTPVNDAPTSTNLQGDIRVWTEHDAALLLDVGSNVTIADVDNANFAGGTLTVAITGGLVAAEDSLGITTGGTVTAGAGTVSVGGTQIATFTGGGAGGSALVFTLDSDATPAAVQALMRAINYANSGGDNPTDGDRTITWTLVDGGGTANGGDEDLVITSTVNVNPVNDAPAGADDSATIGEDATHVFAAGDFNLTDVDGNDFAGIVITTLPSNGTIRLNGVAVTSGQFVTAADIGAGLLVYTPDANENGIAHDSFTFQVRDDGGTSGGGVDTDPNPDTFTFDVNALNDAPFISNINSDNAVYTEGGAPVALDVGTLATISDVDNSNFNGGSLTVTMNAVGDDVLDIAGATVTVDPMTFEVSVSGTVIGIMAPVASPPQFGFTIALNADATPARVQEVLRSLVYSNAGDDPTGGTRTVTYTLVDGGGFGAGETDTIIATSTISVTPVNDAPAGADKTVTVSEDDPYVFTTADFGFSDVDGDALTEVIITTLPADGALLLDGVAVLSLQAIAVADIVAGKLTFAPAADEFGDGYASFTFQVRDDGGTSNGGVDTDQTPNTITIDVEPDNIAPVLDLDSVAAGIDNNAAYTENAASAFLAPDLVTSDVDDTHLESATIMVSGGFIAGADVLSVNGATSGTINGLTIAYNGLTGVLTLTGSGTLADYQAALRQVGFHSNSDAPGASRTLLWTINDGDASSAAATTTIAVTQSNDLPAGADLVFGTDEDTALVLAASHFGFTDLDGTLASVSISAVSGGKIFYDADGAGPGLAAEATLPQVFTAADLADGKVRFVPTANANGAALGSVTFTVTDDQGGNDATANTLTIDVDAVNDAPQIVAAASPVAATEQTPLAILAGVTVSDVDLDAKNGGLGDYAGASFGVNRNPVVNAQDQFSLVAGPNFTISGNNLQSGGLTFATISVNGAGLIVINFTSAQTVATSALVDEVIQAIRYTNSSDTPPPSVQLSYALFDGSPGGGQGTGATNAAQGLVTVNITAVNDAPINTLTPTQAGTEDVNIVFSAANGNGITCADNDATILEVTLSVNSGTLTLTGTAGLSFTSGDGTADGVMTFSGTASAINAALDGLVYRGSLNHNGSDWLTITTSDLGADGTGGTLTDTDAIAITLAPDGMIQGDAGNNFLTGTPHGDLFVLNQGGSDSAAGLGNNDRFYFGEAWGLGDSIDGGAGDDALILAGDYNYTFGNQLTNVERIRLLSGGGADYDYRLEIIDANVAAGRQMRIDALDLVAGEDLVFVGMAETDGSFNILGGAGNDLLVGGLQNDSVSGGAGNDTLYGLLGNDRIEGGLGADFLNGGSGRNTFVYNSAADSTGAAFDTIQKFSAYVDKIDLPFTVTGWTGTMSGTLDASSFDAGIAAVDGLLEANSAVLFTANGGDMNGRIFAVFDVDGDGTYQAGQDLVIEFQTPVALFTHTVAYFI